MVAEMGGLWGVGVLDSCEDREPVVKGSDYRSCALKGSKN